MDINAFFKSIVDQDKAAVVICDTEHKIIYINPSAAERYKKSGGYELVGKSLLDCHNDKSNDMIKKIVAWFGESEDNNYIYTYRNLKENKDVYMIALRDANKKLIGYYEKHEYRNKETAEVYDFGE